ncbi:hypothetical protein CBR_g12065 [Chara braunii]|uniref:Hexosyltransferase n=1 Tax=Chara braunii TaxID=69332 RepID=A0A388KR06_CHABU|nr:hypothetical protein CBR_g12065 [Chara braunii]|eukprot:GBG72494.1 hypothetical protein CBR_g12065 [Chara braunii]
MKLYVSPSMRRITISTTGGAGLDAVRVRFPSRRWTYRCVFLGLLGLAFILPALFIVTAVLTLPDCTGEDCFSEWRTRGRVSSEDKGPSTKDPEIPRRPPTEDIPETYEKLVRETAAYGYNTETIIAKLKAMEEKMHVAMLQRALFRHIASVSVPKGIHCLSLHLAAEYASNPRAQRPLPSEDKAWRLVDNRFHHIVLITDNVLAASVVVKSTVNSTADSSRLVFHIITDDMTYAAMHAWFALYDIGDVTVEVMGMHQIVKAAGQSGLSWHEDKVLDAFERAPQSVENHLYGAQNADFEKWDSPMVEAARMQAKNPRYVSWMNYLRMCLPEVFPKLDKVVFLDDDVVVRRDLSELWEIDLQGKVNGAVQMCGTSLDRWIPSKTFRSYFNFSNPVIKTTLDPEECAWAYGMNVFDLRSWRQSNITRVYHSWQKQNIESNLTLWRLGMLPAALIAFRGHVRPIDPSWHVLGLGYQPEITASVIDKAAIGVAQFVEGGDVRHVQKAIVSAQSYTDDWSRKSVKKSTTFQIVVLAKQQVECWSRHSTLHAGSIALAPYRSLEFGDWLVNKSRDGQHVKIWSMVKPLVPRPVLGN